MKRIVNTICIGILLIIGYVVASLIIGVVASLLGDIAVLALGIACVVFVAWYLAGRDDK